MLLLPASVFAWSNGHAGIDRPGAPADIIAVHRRLPSTAACFEACLSLEACASWTFKSAQCSDATCTLRKTAPKQSLAPPDGGCETFSGTTAPVRAGGLLPLQYQPLPLGTVIPRGWLRDQLVTMANGLSGHLELFWDDVHDSVWIGGTHDHSGAGHERGPYWLNGMVPLSAMLNATGDATDGSLKVDINEQVNRWVTKILDAQLPSGWLGPDDGFGGKGNTYWNGWNVAASLLQYADAQAAAGRAEVAARCNSAVLRYVTEVHKRMLATPMTSWSQNRWQVRVTPTLTATGGHGFAFACACSRSRVRSCVRVRVRVRVRGTRARDRRGGRWQDWAYIVHWLSDQAPQGQEQLLWDAAELTRDQSWDWDSYYARTGVGAVGALAGKPMPKFAVKNVPGWTMYDHGVNNAMGTKSCAVWYRQSRNGTDAAASYTKLAMQDTYHGQPHGMWAADECFGGRDLNRGIELCAARPAAPAAVSRACGRRATRRVTAEQMYSLQHMAMAVANPTPSHPTPPHRRCAVVEQMYSLQHMFRVQGDVSFLDK